MAYRPLATDRLYPAEAEAEALLSDAVRMMPFAAPPGDEGRDAGGRAGQVIARAGGSGSSVIEEVAEIIAAERKSANRPVLIAVAGEGAAVRIAELLDPHLGAGAVERVTDIDQIQPGGVFIMEWLLESGFQTDSVLVITETDIFGQRLSRPRARRGRGEDFLREVSALEEGDLVVHAEHGIGRYEGLVIINSSGGPHDCLQLVYSGGDKLYLPVENIEMLSRYGSAGSDAELDKLGSAAWQARVARVLSLIHI